MATRAKKAAVPQKKTVKKTAKKAVRKIVRAAVKKTVKAPGKKKASKKTPVRKSTAKKSVARKAAPKAKKASRLSVASFARVRGVTVDDYARDLTGWKKEVVEKLRKIVKEVAPNATESIRWGQPVFELNGPFAWIKAFTKHVGYGFWRGTELPDPARVLEGDGDRMRHVKIHAPISIPFEALRQLIRDAIEANLAKGDPTKR